MVGAQPPAEPLWKLHVRASVVLAEWRISNHPVESLELARIAMHRMQKRVCWRRDVRAVNAVQHHVEFADRPGRRVVHLTAKPQVGRVTAGLLDEFATDDEHATRTACWIVHTHAGNRLEDADHQSDHVARRVEVAALFAGRFGKHVDEKLVGGAKEVRELKVFIAQAVSSKDAN